MSRQFLKKGIVLSLGAMFCLGLVTVASAATSVGLAAIADNVKGSLVSFASLITAGAYVAGMAFGVAAVVKFKAHKDNPTQVAISIPIAMLFIAAALLFMPSVFQSTGQSLFGSTGTQGTVTGVSSF